MKVLFNLKDSPHQGIFQWGFYLEENKDLNLVRFALFPFQWKKVVGIEGLGTKPQSPPCSLYMYFKLVCRIVVGNHNYKKSPI